MHNVQYTYKSYIIFEINMLSAQILVQSYDTFRFHISVKSHVYHVKYTDFI